jgi:hypothetical protein
MKAITIIAILFLYMVAGAGTAMAWGKDTTAPKAAITYSKDGGTNYASTATVKDSDTLRIRAIFSEAMANSPNVKVAVDNSVKSATRMIRVSPKEYYYDLNVPSGNVPTATVSLSVGTDLAGNVITSVPTSGATFTIDNTPPTLEILAPSTTSSNHDLKFKFESHDDESGIDSISCEIDGSSFNCQSGNEYDFHVENDGPHTFKVTSRDRSGNEHHSEHSCTVHTTTRLKLTKTATPLTYDALGDVIGYSYLVENTGNINISGPVTVADNKATVTCPAVMTVGNNDTYLNISENITCTASYSITQPDLNEGSVTNKATASADGVNSNEDHETVTAIQNHELTLTKTATPLTYDAQYDVISYSYLVENTGNVKLSGPVAVDDNKSIDESCPLVNTIGNLDNYLDPGENITCTASYSITETDLNIGSVTNKATATATEYSSNTNSCTSGHLLVTSNEDTATVNKDQEQTGGQIPEFPTVALPIAAVIGMVFLFQRRKNKE